MRRGRLSEALAAELGQPQPDEKALAFLGELAELQSLLREKAWARAQGFAKRLLAHYPEYLGDAEADLSTEVARLGESGAKLERGDAEAALTLLDEVTLPLLEAETQTQCGTARVLLGDAEAAEHAFREAVASDPKHYRALTNLGNVLLEAGRIDEAIPFYERALVLNEDFANAHHNLGVAYRRKGQVSRSVASIRKAQRVSRRQNSGDAREALRSLTGGGRSHTGKYLRWALYGVLAVGVYLLFNQGIG